MNMAVWSSSEGFFSSLFIITVYLNANMIMNYDTFIDHLPNVIILKSEACVFTTPLRDSNMCIYNTIKR